MGLNIYITGEVKTKTCICSYCDSEYTKEQAECLFETSITHNLTAMAERAGIYMEVWRPEELCIVKASQLIDVLKHGIKRLKERPEFFKELSSENGWGIYEHFVPWLESYLDACEKNPDGKIVVSR